MCTLPPIDYLHNYKVFDHCQLFSQHSWPQFICCQSIGIVKVSHKKLTSPFHPSPCLCVPPQLTICTITKFLTIANFFHNIVGHNSLLPEHRHCEGLSQEINLPFSPLSLTVCTPPPPPIDYMHNYEVFDHCQLFPQHTWPEFIFHHNIGIAKVSHKKLTSHFHWLCVPPWLTVCTPPPPQLTICTIL